MIKDKIYILDKIIDVFLFDTIYSTNDYLYERLNNIINDTLVISKEQTNGHGTNDRSFISKKDVGIYFSLLINYTDEREIKYITEKVAVSIYRVLKEKYNLDTMIKWVNDIYLNNKKVAGILCKNSIYNKKVIIGIGIDLYKDENLDDNIKDIAGYIFEEKIDEMELVKFIVEDIYKNIKKYDILKEYIEKRIIL